VKGKLEGEGEEERKQIHKYDNLILRSKCKKPFPMFGSSMSGSLNVSRGRASRKNMRNDYLRGFQEFVVLIWRCHCWEMHLFLLKFDGLMNGCCGLN
jgi:hypothetical protein